MQGLIVDFAQFAAMIAKLADKARDCTYLGLNTFTEGLIVEKLLLALNQGSYSNGRWNT